MSKKSKRQTTAEPAASSATFGGLQRTAPEFNPDYSQVKRDLRRIAILASSFFVILVALSFFLR